MPSTVLSINSWLSETISDLEAKMDRDLGKVTYSREQAAHDGGKLEAYLDVEQYLSEQVENV